MSLFPGRDPTRFAISNLSSTLQKASKAIYSRAQATRWHHTARSLLRWIAVGLAAGMAAIVFDWTTETALNLSLSKILPEDGLGQGWIWLLLLPSLGGFAAGICIHTFAPEAEGPGTNAVLLAYHQQGGAIRRRVPWIKWLASTLTLGSGGAGGKEGPIAQIGAGLGAYLGQRLGLSPAERRTLLAAGMAAGVGAIFRAPLAGALFAAEIHYRDPEFESEAVVPSAIASITAYCLFCLVTGWEPLFQAQDLGFRNPWELLPYTLLAAVVALGAVGFIRILNKTQSMFAKLKMWSPWRPAIGGLLLSLWVLALAWFGHGDQTVRDLLGFGYDVVNRALHGQVALTVFLMVAFGKAIATALTLGSGGAAGVFGPSVVIGACLGGAMGSVLHAWMPHLVPHPEAFVLVGMAGFFAAGAKTPISTIIMVSEMTGHYRLLLPCLWVSTLAYMLVRKSSLYSAQIRSRVDSPAHRGDLHYDVLAGIKVAEVFDRDAELIQIRRETPLGEVLHKVSATQQMYFPIVDASQKMCGIFSLNDVRAFMYDESIWTVAIAEDVATGRVVSVTPLDDLNTAISRFTRRNIDELPVVSPDDPTSVLGFLRRKDVVDAYNRKLWDLRNHDAEQNPTMPLAQSL